MKHFDKINEDVRRSRVGVVRSLEFRRVEALPRRLWETDDLPALAEALTSVLRTESGTMRLRPAQAAALRDAYEVGGLFGPLRVGVGKALLSLCVPVLLGATRPVLLLPASLREQTRREVVPQMSEHWKLHPDLKLIGYEELGLEQNAGLLDELAPDLIVADEVHALANIKAGRTRRVARYLDAHPECRFVAFSGTVTRRSLRDYAHLIAWCLRDGSPLPLQWRELQDWADALDADVPEERRVAPGALHRVCGVVRDGDDARNETAREGFARRLRETPGVVATGEDELGASLVIAERRVEVPPEVRAHLHRLRTDWELPNGDYVSEATELWRHARTIASGLFYRWDPPPPREWLEPRRAWKQYVRHVLAHNRRNLDTELQVWNECARAVAAGERRPEYSEWLAVRDTFEPNSVPVWQSRFLVEDCVRWLAEVGEGIVWTEHAAFLQALGEAGVCCYGPGARASRDILTATGPIACSVRAHGQGRNLQRYSRALVVSCPPSGRQWEQCIGRLHRSGQEADEVRFDMYLHTPELRAALGQALADARYIEDTTGSQQKLCFARIVALGETET